MESRSPAGSGLSRLGPRPALPHSLQRLLARDSQNHTASPFLDPGFHPLINKHAASPRGLPPHTVFHFLLLSVPAWTGHQNHQRKRGPEGLGLQELLNLQQRRQPVHVLLHCVLAPHFGGKQQHEPTGSQELLLCLCGIEGTVAKSTVSHLEQQPDHYDDDDDDGHTRGRVDSECREFVQERLGQQITQPLARSG